MPKALFFDIDNTLLDDKILKLRPSSVEALKKLKAAGFLVIAASSRAYLEMRVLFGDIFSFDAMVLSSGARIYVNDKIVQSHFLTKMEVAAVIEFRNANPDTNMLYSCDDEFIYTEKDDDVTGHPWFYEKEIPFKIRELNPDDQVFQLFINSKAKADQVFLDKMANSDVRYQFYTYMSIYPKKTNKGVGCKEIITWYGLTPDDCACFGDSLNDYEMFELIKESYCLGNGRKELKAIAKEVIGSVHEDGVYNLCVKKGWIV